MKHRILSRKFLVGAGFAAILASLSGSQIAQAQGEGDVMVPVFEADGSWPKPLPNGWVIGQTIGLAADKQDNIWIVHRPGSLEEKEVYLTRKQGDCCTAAPDVLEFSPTGDLMHHWGKVAGHDWPSSNHGITVDDQGNVWLGANGGGQPPAYAPGSQAQFDAARGARGARAQAANVTSGSAPEPTGGTACTRGEYHDSFMLKFTQDGKFLGEIGKANGSRGSLDKNNVCGVATIKFIPGTNELVAADGYGNHRVSVWDPVTMKLKRLWGAYGKPPTDLVIPHYNVDSPQFGNPVHCAMPSNDGLIYVCDRTNNRIQVFKTDGTYLKQYPMEVNTRGDGSAWEIAFSRDPQQKFMYISDGSNEKIHVYDRASMKEIYSFGGGGRQPGQFYAVHSIVTDSKGNIYTTETYRGQRVQKFTYKGLQSLNALMKKGVTGNSLIYAPPKN
jgi:DNA-binding beta-propeller fold protein YncE